MVLDTAEIQSRAHKTLIACRFILDKPIVKTHIAEEHAAPVSGWDFLQAITANGRRIPRQDKRLVMEKRTTQLMKSFTWLTASGPDFAMGGI